MPEQFKNIQLCITFVLHFTAHAVLDSFLLNFVLVFNNLMRFKVDFYDLLFINLLALMKSRCIQNEISSANRSIKIKAANVKV